MARERAGARTGRGWTLAVLLGVLLLSWVAPARAGELVPVRGGIHRGYGRLVFDFPGWTGWWLHRHGDVLRLRFSRKLAFGPDPKLPPQILSLRYGAGWARVRVTPGAKIRRMRVGGRLVLDVIAPAAKAAGSNAAGRASLLARRDGPTRVTAPGVSLGGASSGAAVHAPPAAGAAAPSANGAGGTAGHATGLGASTGPGRTAGSGPGTAGPGTRGSGAPRPRSGGAAGSARPASPQEAAAAPPAAPGNRLGAPAAGIAGSADAGGTVLGQAGAGAPGTAPAAPSAAAIATPVYPLAPGPVALAARPEPSGAIPGAAPGHPDAILVPFEASVGAAAFRRVGLGVVVFDTPRPIDLSALRGTKIFGTARVHLLAAGTEIVLALPRGTRLHLRRRKRGWEIALRPPAAAPANAPATAPGTIRPVARPKVRPVALLLRAPDPGRVVSLLDPETGLPLLVGTERGPGAGLPLRRRAPQFDLLRSWRGVVVAALSDRLRLRPVAGGFLLHLRGGRLAISPNGTALTDAALLTRRFHFPDLPLAALSARLRAELRRAAVLPPLARGRALRRAAKTMIALGMGAEAGALLHLGATEDPREAAAPDHKGLAAVAALLAARPASAPAGTARGIGDPRLSGSDEVALWRAVRAAERDPASARAAQLFAATAPLILTYPRELRRALLPLAAETMVRGGEDGVAARLIGRRPDDPRLALARGMLDAARGRDAAALVIYDRLAAGADRLARFRAATRAVALRLAGKTIGARQAAAQLDRLADAWRGGDRELALRATLAGLRAKAGAWGRALGLLRRTIHDFPAARPALRVRLRRVFAAMLADPRFDRASPLRFVALVRGNADLLAKGQAGEAAEARLADRLQALDLPDQAAPVLARLMRASPSPAGRAGFGARLAALRLRQGDARGASRALVASAADGLAPDLAARRAMLAARIQAAEGQEPAALAALSALDSGAADRAAARIAERARDWTGAAGALGRLVARAVPAQGGLDPAQRRILLRLATARVRAGDTAGVVALRGAQARMGTGPLADMFRLLTAPGVHDPAQLARARTTAALAEGLGAALKSVR